jgi:hypothetical protein
MVWTSISPDGTISVRQNTAPMAANTAYIETSMNVDHYWNIGVNEDGHHKQFQSPKLAADPAVAAGMDGAIYLKTVSASDTSIQGFYRNVLGVYQFIPGYKTGVLVIPNNYNYQIVTSVPPHSYGHIYVFKDDDTDNMAMGYFKAGATVVNAYHIPQQIASGTSITDNLRFGNNAEAAGLNILARKSTGGVIGNFIYKIVYWGI